MAATTVALLALGLGAGCGGDSQSGDQARAPLTTEKVTVITPAGQPATGAAPNADSTPADATTPATVTGSSAAGESAVTPTGEPAVCAGTSDTQKCDLRP